MKDKGYRGTPVPHAITTEVLIYDGFKTTHCSFLQFNHRVQNRTIAAVCFLITSNDLKQKNLEFLQPQHCINNTVRCHHFVQLATYHLFGIKHSKIMLDHLSKQIKLILQLQSIKSICNRYKKIKFPCENI